MATLETARLYLPRLNKPKEDGEHYTMATSVSAAVVGCQLNTYDDIRWSNGSPEHVYCVGVGVGYMMAMQHAGKVPMWVLALASSTCIHDMHPKAQDKFLLDMKEYLLAAGVSMNEVVIFSRCLPAYLVGYDPDDIAVMMNRTDNPIRDHFNRDPRIDDLELM